MRNHTPITRINIVGNSGSGKTTVGRALAALLQLPFHEIDAAFWQPNWTMSSDEELLLQIRQVTDNKAWVLDGNYSRSIPVKWQRVQLVIWIDTSFLRNMWQILRRTLSRTLTGKELWPGTGNRESLRSALFSRDSILLWALTHFRTTRSQYSAAMLDDQYSQFIWLRLRSAAEIRKFLERLLVHLQQGENFNRTFIDQLKTDSGDHVD